MISDAVKQIADKYLGKVKRSGSENVMAVCPFHRKADGSPEHTPSFALSLTTGLWFCHSCKESGNLRTLLRAFDISPLLRDKQYQLLLEELDNNATGKPRGKRVKLELDQPPLDEGVLGLFYSLPVALEQEGFQESTLFRFGVGYDSRNRRITYPIRDLMGRLVGFSGRTTEDSVLPRYKFYDEFDYRAWDIPPRTIDKADYLWNGDHVYPIAFHKGLEDIIVVEGFKACMWLWQAGIPNVVALMGSHLSHNQRLILERMGSTVYLFLDTNDAGIEGALHAGRLLSESMQVRVVPYEAPQPTDLSEEEVLRAMSGSVDFLRWTNMIGVPYGRIRKRRQDS